MLHLTVYKTLRLNVLLPLALLLVIISGCGSLQQNQSEKLVTLLFTNDFESAYDPIPAFWRDDMVNIGGIAELATLIENQRAAHSTLFLFDAGDIFTGTLGPAYPRRDCL